MIGGFGSFMKTPIIQRGESVAPILATVGEDVRRGFGLVLMVVGCFMVWPAVVLGLGFLWPAQRIDATMVERYYLAEARHDSVDADGKTGPSLDRFRSTIVLEYADAKGRVHRVAFLDRNPGLDIGGLLDAQVPLDRLEIRFPEGLLSALMRAPPLGTYGGMRHEAWMRSAYDSLHARIQNPAEFVARSWTAPRGATVPILVSPVPLAPPILARSDRFHGVMAAMPVLVLGLGFAIGGMRAALGFEGKDRASHPSRRSGNSRWWLILVLSSPLWAVAAPSTLGYFGVPGARFLVETMQRSPYVLMELFGSPSAGEAAPDLPKERITFPSSASLYAPLWDTLDLQRPERCCRSRQDAIKAASASVRESLLVMSAEQRAAVFDQWRYLQMVNHFGFDPILEPIADQFEGITQEAEGFRTGAE
jgi:hypothetical protein